ncbi:hypothetical protein [Bacillus manliponensis]|uniref:hypothetical protein n=1 Tax=Bacillus manliponensis TaxID=574376 RepID=UPI000AD756E5|nr:hypothetical protein [Bacillus manliponensis]
MKNLMKKIGVSSLALTLGMMTMGTLPQSANAEAANPVLLTEEQIIERFEEINQKSPYNVEFSKEDADFVKTYADSPVFGESEMSTLAKDSRYFNKLGSGAGGSARINGYVWDDIGYVNHTYGAYYSTQMQSGKAKKLLTLLRLMHMVQLDKVV